GRSSAIVWNRRSTPSSLFGGQNSNENTGAPALRLSMIFMLDLGRRNLEVVAFGGKSARHWARWPRFGPWRPILGMHAAMRIFVTGVAGTGMGPIAGLWKELGHDVAGRDTASGPPMGPLLRKWGIRLYQGFDAAHRSGK